MALVPAIPARGLPPAPAPHPPLTFEAPLAYEDRLAGSLQSQWPRLDRQRRRILTVGLPMMWFLVCLGTVSVWVTTDENRGFGTLVRDLARFDPLPLALCLAAITACLLIAWAVFPARMRGRMRTMMGPRGRDGPMRVHYRFDADGITETLPDLAGFVPWIQVRGLDEDRRRLFIAVSIGEEPIAIPKAELAPDTAEGVRLRVRDWAGRGAAPEPPPDADAAVVRVVVDLTAADRAALIVRALTTPAARRGRLFGAAGWIVGLALLYPALVAALWCVDPHRVPFGSAGPLFVEMIGTDFWQPAAGAVVLVALALAANRIWRGHAARALAEEVTAEAPRSEAGARIAGRDLGAICRTGEVRHESARALLGSVRGAERSAAR